jgi:signal recognition particle subunit SRP54
MGRIEAIICAMTPAERRDHTIVNGSRRRRIATGSGTSVEDVNRLLKQFTDMRRVLQMIGQGGAAGLGRGMKLPKMPPRTLAAPGKKRKKGGPWGLIKTR